MDSDTSFATIPPYINYMSQIKPLADKINVDYKKICSFDDKYAAGIAGLIVQRVKVYNACTIQKDQLVYEKKTTEALVFYQKMENALDVASSVVDYLSQREEAAQQAKDLAENAAMNAAPAIVKLPGKLVKILGRFMTDIEINEFIGEVASDVAKDKAQDQATSAMDLFEPVAQSIRDKFDAANQNRLPKFLASYDCQ